MVLRKQRLGVVDKTHASSYFFSFLIKNHIELNTTNIIRLLVKSEEDNLITRYAECAAICFIFWCRFP